MSHDELEARTTALRPLAAQKRCESALPSVFLELACDGGEAVPHRSYLLELLQIVLVTEPLNTHTHHC